MTKLMHRRETAENGEITDAHMTRELRIIREDRVVADLAVVREMHVRHDPVVVAEPRNAGVLYGAAIERAKFANGVAIADFKARGFARILLVLRRFAQ